VRRTETFEQTTRKQKTRRRLLQVAARAIRREGPHRVGVADVMGRAGLTHGGFYAHFEDRDALVAAAVEESFRQACARIERLIHGATALAGLAAYVDFYLSPAHRDSRTYGCPLPFLAGDVPRMSAGARARFADGMNELVALLVEPFGRLGRSAPEADAVALLSELSGTLLLALLQRLVGEEAD
jgi:TetR/AcrR family transcriptional repressor of nem operon